MVSNRIQSVLDSREARREALARAREDAHAKARLKARNDAFVEETNRLGAEAAAILLERGVPMRRFLLTTGPAWGTYANHFWDLPYWLMRLRADGTVLIGSYGRWTKITDRPDRFVDCNMTSWLADFVENIAKHEGRLSSGYETWFWLTWTVKPSAVCAVPNEED